MKLSLCKQNCLKEKKPRQSLGKIDRVFKYFQKSYHQLTRDPSFFVMGKLARFDAVRSGVGNFHKVFYKPNENSQSDSLFQKLDVDKVVYSLETNGYSLDINLPPPIVQEFQEFAQSTICCGDRDPDYQFYYTQKKAVEAAVDKQFRIGSYMDNIQSCPAFQKLRNDPVLLAIAARYLGTQPQYIGSELYWSFPTQAIWTEQIQAAQVFHVDLDDYRSIKFFFYLTDVDPSSGPHICIRGTHKHKTFLHQLLGGRCASIDDRKLVNCYGSDNVLTICGQAGFGFAEDPSCFHKATVPSRKDRLMLQIEFAVSVYKTIQAVRR